MSKNRKIQYKQLRDLRIHADEIGVCKLAKRIGMSERGVHLILKAGRKKVISKKTSDILHDLVAHGIPAEAAKEEVAEPVLVEQEEPEGPTAPPILAAVAQAIHEGILEAERGRQPMMHMLQASVLRLEEKVDLLAKSQLEEMIAWGLKPAKTDA